MPTQQRRPDPLGDIELLLRSRYPLILLDTEEEDRAESLMREWARGRTVSAQ